MKIALLSKYSRLGASSRLRTFQYLPALKNAGFEVQLIPLFDDNYLHHLYAGRRSIKAILSYYYKRIRILRDLVNVDLIWLEYEGFPYFPYWLEKFLLPTGVPYIVDYDDAVFHNYDQSSHSLVRLLSHKIDKVMANAALVICGNEYLASRARKSNAKHVKIVPTVIELSRYSLTKRNVDQGSVIGWAGSPSTQKYILDILPSLQNICGDNSARLVLVGAHPDFSIGLPDEAVDIVEWSEESESQAISNFDIGIMPLPDEPWARGKCGYKLIQYMACGLPVIASPVGVNTEIVEHGVNGFLANTQEEWCQALTTLKEDSALRKKMGDAGRRKVEEKYCLQVTAPILLDLLQATLKRENKSCVA